MLDKENGIVRKTLVNLSLASYRNNFASRSAGHHSILQGRNPNHPPSEVQEQPRNDATLLGKIAKMSEVSLEQLREELQSFSQVHKEIS